MASYHSCVSTYLCVFPLSLASLRAFSSRLSSRLGTRARGTAVHLVPCLTISLSLITPFSWTTTQSHSHYLSYNAHATVRIASRSGSERPSATRRLLIFPLSFRLASRLYSHPPSRLDHRRKTTASKSLSVPLSQPPASPFYLNCFSLFLVL